MTGRPARRPNRYRVRVTTPEWTAECLIECGFCTSADGKLVDFIGKSAPWIKGHLMWKNWRGTMLPPPDTKPAQSSLL